MLRGSTHARLCACGPVLHTAIAQTLEGCVVPPQISTLQKVHPEDAFPVYDMHGKVHNVAKDYFKMPKPRRLPNDMDFLQRTQDAQL